MDILAAISNSSYFAGLSPQSKTRLASACLERFLKKREVLFTEGEAGNALYLSLSGNIQLSKLAPDGNAHVIKIIQPGEIFAEVILFESPKYPVTAEALTECLLIELPRKAFHELLTEEAFRNEFIATLLGKQRYLTDRIYQLTALDVEARLFSFLQEYFGDNKSIELNLTKKQIAAAIGATPETLSRLLQKLEDEGRLTWCGKRIEIA